MFLSIPTLHAIYLLLCRISEEHKMHSMQSVIALHITGDCGRMNDSPRMSLTDRRRMPIFFFVRCVSRVSRLHLHRLKRWIKRRYIMFMRVDWCNLQQQHAEQTHTHATYTLETKQKKLNE